MCNQDGFLDIIFNGLKDKFSDLIKETAKNPDLNITLKSADSGQRANQAAPKPKVPSQENVAMGRFGSEKDDKAAFLRRQQGITEVHILDDEFEPRRQRITIDERKKIVDQMKAENKEHFKSMT